MRARSYGRLGAIVSRRLRSSPLDSGLGSHAFQQSVVFPMGKHVRNANGFPKLIDREHNN
jgi:hypothetical protein